MRPRFFAAENGCTSTPAEMRPFRFNEAAVFRRGEHGGPGDKWLVSIELQ